MGCCDSPSPEIRSANFDLSAQAERGGTGSVALHLHAHYRAMRLDPKPAGDEVAAVHAPSDSAKDSPLFIPDSGQAWVRLALALVLGSIGSVGMWSVVVVLPVVQPEFGASRRAVSLAFTMTMLR